MSGTQTQENLFQYSDVILFERGNFLDSEMLSDYASPLLVYANYIHYNIKRFPLTLRIIYRSPNPSRCLDLLFVSVADDTTYHAMRFYDFDWFARYLRQFLHPHIMKRGILFVAEQWLQEIILLLKQTVIPSGTDIRRVRRWWLFSFLDIIYDLDLLLFAIPKMRQWLRDCLYSVMFDYVHSALAIESVRTLFCPYLYSFRVALDIDRRDHSDAPIFVKEKILEAYYHRMAWILPKLVSCPRTIELVKLFFYQIGADKGTSTRAWEELCPMPAQFWTLTQYHNFLRRIKNAP